MARHWKTRCRQCNAPLGYSDALARRDATLGRPPAQTCSDCDRKLMRELRAVPAPEADLGPGRAEVESPFGTLVARAPEHTRCDQPSELDVSKFGVQEEELKQLYRTLADPKVPVVIAVAPTGSGKSTYMPYRLLEPFALDWFPADTFTRYGQIVITQPRIAPTREIPGYVSGKMHGMPPGKGYDIGYRYSGNPLCDWRCRMVYVTDGTLINWLAAGDVDKMGLVMIDEAHERSLNIDIIIGLLARLLPRHPHLKVLIASATIDADKFKRYFNAALPGDMRAEVVEMSGKSYGVTPHFRPRELSPLPYTRELERNFDRDMPRQVADEVIRVLMRIKTGEPIYCNTAKTLIPTPPGDIVAFLHGAAPIEEAVELIRAGLTAHPELAKSTDVYPLYRAVPRDVQDAALKEKKDKSRRRVIVSSNMAETSLTIEGIVHVVESGVIKVMQWDPVLEKSSLRAMTHSQGGCRQRWGRAGRLAAGHSWCLYTEDQFNNLELFPKETPPDILKSPLDQITLDAKRAGADAVNGGAFPWIDRPSEAEFAQAATRLRRQGALDADGDLTAAGFDLRNSGGDTTTAKLLATADRFGLAIEAATIIPIIKAGWKALMPHDREWPGALSDRVRTARQRLRFGCRDDLEFGLKLYQQWQEAREGTPLVTNAPEWRDLWGRASKHFAGRLLGNAKSPEAGALRNALAAAQWVGELDEIVKESGVAEGVRARQLPAIRDAFRATAGRVWALRSAVDEGALKAVHSEREKLIEAVGVKKKEMERRDLHFGALERLRVLFAWCLPDHVFIPNELPMALELTDDGTTAPEREPNGDGDQFYRAMFEDAANQGFRALIDRDSTLAGREVEAFITCGAKDEQRARGDGPAPKVKTVYLPFAVEVEPGVVRAVQGLSELALSVYLSKNFPRPSAPDAGKNVAARLFMDARHPVGSRVRCEVVKRDADGAFAVEVRANLGSTAIAEPCGLPDVARHRPDEEQLDRQDREYSPWAKNDKSADPPSFDAAALEAENPSVNLVDESEELPAAPRRSGRPEPESYRFAGRLLVLGAVAPPAVGAEFEAAVVGHGITGENPAVLLATPDRTERFDAFTKANTTGSTVEVIAANELGLPLPNGAALFVREPISGLDIAVAAGDLGLQHPDVLANAIKPGTRLCGEITCIDREGRSAEITLLPEWDRAMERFATAPRQVHDAVVRHIHGNNCWLHLAAGTGLVAPARLHVEKGEDGIAVMPFPVGHAIKVFLEFRPRSLARADEPSRRTIDATAPLNALGLSWTGDRFAFQGRMSYARRQELLERTTDPVIRDAIVTLHLESNTPTARLVLSDLDKRFPKGKKVEGKVVRVLYSDGLVIFALPEGAVGHVPKDELDWLDPNPRLDDAVTVGQVLSGVVLSADTAKQVVRVSVKNLRPNPWPALATKYQKGMVVNAKVSAVRDDGGVAIELESGLRCFVPAAFVGERLKEGQAVRAKIHEVNAVERRIKLNLKDLTEDPWLRLIPTKYKTGTVHRGTVKSAQHFGVFVELEPGVQGLVHVSELADFYVSDPTKVVKVGQELHVKVVKVDTGARKLGLSAKQSGRANTLSRAGAGTRAYKSHDDDDEDDDEDDDLDDDLDDDFNDDEPEDEDAEDSLDDDLEDDDLEDDLDEDDLDEDDLDEDDRTRSTKA